jgi:hypothetical protein
MKRGILMARPLYARMKKWHIVLFSVVIGLVLICSPVVISRAAGQTNHGSSSPNFGTCGIWKLVPGTADVPGNNDYLNGVADYFRTDLWAVGYTINSSGTVQTLAESWDSHTLKWSVYPTPNPGVNNVLNGLISTASNDFWAVGDSYTAGPTTDSQTLVEEWNNYNKGWYIVPSPNVGTYNTLNALAQIPNSSNIWAVGSSSLGSLIEEWNGTSWSVIPSPNPTGTSITLNAISALTATQAWAVGNYVDSDGQTQTLIEKWNGTAWKIIPSPNVSGATSNVLNGLSRTNGAKYLWAVGSYSMTGQDSETLIEQWTGSGWSIVPSPNVGNSALYAVSEISTSNSWALGYSTNKYGVMQTLAEQWNGTTWNVMFSPNKGHGANYFHAAAKNFDHYALWAVGSYHNNQTTSDDVLIADFC